MTRRGRIVLGVIGFGLIGLAFASLILQALWQVKSGQDWGYSNYKNQPMTYLGLLASMALVGLIGVVGLWYRLKKAIENRRDRKAAKVSQ